MTHVLAVIAFLLLPLVGIAIWRLDAVRRMDIDARLATAGAAGAAIIAAIMATLSIVGIGWSRTTLVAILTVISAIGIYTIRRSTPRTKANHSAEVAPLSMILLFVILVVYGLLSARESCGDLHFQWGPKAVRFYRDGGVTVSFLTDENSVRMNPGSPLMLPLLYAWSNTLAKQFSWWAAVLSTAFFLFGSVALVRGVTRDQQGALLMAATLAYTTAVAFAAGGADPPLLFFETLTIVALTFIDDPRGRAVLAAIGLSGAVMMKIEGTTFAIAAVVAFMIVERDMKRALLIAAPAAALLAAWLWFVKANGIFELYRGAGMPIYFEAIPKVLTRTANAATYNLFGLPWIVPSVLLVLSRRWRAAALPLVVAVLTLAATLFFYLHVADPVWWIESSAPRVLLTPLTALLIAAVAARSVTPSVSEAPGRTGGAPAPRHQAPRSRSG